jgi:hypothetical protein
VKALKGKNKGRRRRGKEGEGILKGKMDGKVRGKGGGGMERRRGRF